MNVDPWTLYWQSDKLESCIAMTSADDAREIAAYWQAFASQLHDFATVLDLASGNGAVPSMMLAEYPGLKFVAVDKAEIEPPKYLSQTKELETVRFLPGVDVCNLPFEDESFDAVTSQFGLEYAPLACACKSAARVLKKSGAIRLLMHHVDSEIVRPSKQTLREITDLLAAGGVMEKVGFFATNQIDLAQLEAAGQQYLQTETAKTEHVSGQIFGGINQLIEGINTNPDLARALAETMALRLHAEQARLLQLRRAALSTEQVSQLRQEFVDSGIVIDVLETLVLANPGGGQALIGWQLSGRKK